MTRDRETRDKDVYTISYLASRLSLAADQRQVDALGLDFFCTFLQGRFRLGFTNDRAGAGVGIGCLGQRAISHRDIIDKDPSVTGIKAREDE